MSIAYDARDYSQNAYSSPQSAWGSLSENRPERTTRWLFFSLNGRITRGQFWTASILTYASYLGFLVAMNVFAGVLRYDALKIGVLLSGAAVYIWSMFAIHVKRWHDRGKPGIWVLLFMLPILGPLWILFELGFLPGNSSTNEFGPPDETNQRRPVAALEPAIHISVERDLSCFALSAENRPEGSSARTAARRWM
jgi:uncharacterized membrane protein YhaH (DUF805 family)